MGEIVDGIGHYPTHDKILNQKTDGKHNQEKKVEMIRQHFHFYFFIFYKIDSYKKYGNTRFSTQGRWLLLLDLACKFLQRKKQ